MKEQDEIIPDISESGIFVRSVGEPKGQISDWRTFKKDIESGVHAVEYEDRFELHVDLYDPHQHPLKHLLFDVGPVAVVMTVASRSVFKKLRGKT